MQGYEYLLAAIVIGVIILKIVFAVKEAKKNRAENIAMLNQYIEAQKIAEDFLAKKYRTITWQ